MPSTCLHSKTKVRIELDQLNKSAINTGTFSRTATVNDQSTSNGDDWQELTIGKRGIFGCIPSSERTSVRSNMDSGGDEAAQSNVQSIPPTRFATLGIDRYSLPLESVDEDGRYVYERFLVCAMPRNYNALRTLNMNEPNPILRITSNAAILGGKPVIRGTRLSVEFILNLLARGATNREIITEYNGLQDEDIQACLLFASKSLANASFVPLIAEPA